jgi:Tfp pilus assembly protein PilF
MSHIWGSLERRLLEHILSRERKNLLRIEVKIAEFTELYAPIPLLNQRDEIEEHITQIQERLRHISESPPPGYLEVVVLIVAALTVGVVIAIIVGATTWKIITKSRPDLLAPATEFGIAIAEFGEGPKFKSSDTGREICEVLRHELERRLKAAYAAERVTLQRAGIVRSSNQAERFGQKGYKIVVWGWWLSEPSGRAVIPTFTVSHLKEAVSFTTYGVLDAPFAALETVELGQHLGTRTEFLMAFLLGLTHLDQGDYGKAVDGFSIAISDAEEIALEFEPESRESTTLQKSQAFLYYYRGRAHFALGELELAQKNFQRALALNPNLVSPYIGLGNIFFRRGDMTSAEKEYEKAAELDPQSVGVHHGIGNVHFLKGDFFQKSCCVISRNYYGLCFEIELHHNILCLLVIMQRL